LMAVFRAIYAHLQTYYPHYGSVVLRKSAK